MALDFETISAGSADFPPADVRGFRAWVRDNKPRSLRSKMMTAAEAVERFVVDGDYLIYDCDYLHRGPAALLREVIRQRRKDLWVGGKFTYLDVSLLAGGGCVSRVDGGYFVTGPTINRLLRDGQLVVYEYSNVVMTNRLMAGAMGLPFVSVCSFGGTDGFERSAAKLVKDPYSGEPVVIVPALHPDIALIHAHQADEYGNSRIFGTGIAHVESAFASRRVIVSTEEIVDSDEIRRDPGRTAIPYYVVDAVIHLPFGAYPGEMQGMYASDSEHVNEAFSAVQSGDETSYLDKWVYDVSDHSEMLDRLVGSERLARMKRRATITEGYQA